MVVLLEESQVLVERDARGVDVCAGLFERERQVAECVGERRGCVFVGL